LSPIPKNQPHSPSSAHTYRLLVFKEHIARQALLQLLSCVAASAAEKRDYEESFSLCQHYFSLSLPNPVTSETARFARRLSSCDEGLNSRSSTHE
ncbi:MULTISPECIES: hypothetical protein, partial [unclassified Caballeronia]|uniref:hypothetical protein n=1 Tax=unclassified Caballeronia TaxID=2646786 RepID=UPI00202809B3